LWHTTWADVADEIAARLAKIAVAQAHHFRIKLFFPQLTQSPKARTNMVFPRRIGDFVKFLDHL
jgi:hypothetical protein